MMSQSSTLSPSLQRYFSARSERQLRRRQPVRFKRLLTLALLLAANASSSAHAAETTNYAYDAKGRLVAVARSGGPANGVQTTYAYDAADNRTAVSTVGQVSSAAAPLIIRLKGLTVVIPQ